MGKRKPNEELEHRLDALQMPQEEAAQPPVPEEPQPPEPQGRLPESFGLRLEQERWLPVRTPMTPYGAQALGSLQAWRFGGEEDMPAMLAVPLHYQHRRILLEALAPPGRKWREEEERLTRDVLEQFALALEHAELFQQIRTALQEVRRLYEATTAINQAGSYDEVLHALREFTALRDQVVYMSIIWMDRPFSTKDRPRWMYMQAQWRATPELPLAPYQRLPFPTDFYTFVQRRLQDAPSLLLDRQDPDQPELLKRLFAMMRVQAFLLAPFVLGGQAHGWFFAAFRHTPRLTENETRILESLLYQASARLSTLYLAEQTRAALEETRLLYRAASAVAEANAYEDLLRILRTYTLVGGEDVLWAALYAFDPPLRPDAQPQTVYRVAEHGAFPQEMPARFRFEAWTENGEHPFRPGFVLQSGNVEEDLGLFPPLLDLARQGGARALLVQTLSVGQEVLGVLVVGFREPRTFKDEDMRLLATLISHTAVRFQGLRLTAELQRLLEITDQLYQASAALNQARSLDEVLDVLRKYTVLGQHDVQAVFFMRLEPPLGDQPQATRGHVEAAWPRPQDDPPLCFLSAQDALWLRDQFIRIQAMPLEDLQGTALAQHMMAILGQMGVTGRYVLLYPLWVGREVMGVILGVYPEPFRFTEEELQALTALQAQVAVRMDGLLHYMRSQSLAAHLRMAAEIARDIGAALSVEEVLDKAVNLIKSRFGFYHVSVFLLDPKGLYAVVQASTGPVGEIMKRSEHRLAVGSTSVVGQTALRGEPVVVNDVTTSDVHRPNPLLPDTQAEAGFPLRIGDRVIGVLDVQATRKYVFTPEMVQVLQLLADQLAVAVESARSYDLSRRALEEIRRADEMKSQFLANMSHELRTPLNSIIGFSRIILKGIDGPINDMQRQDLEAIYNAGQHLLGLINDILDLSKIEAGKMELVFEEVDVRQLLESVLATTRGLLKDKPVELRVEIPEDLPPLYADSKRIRQVLLNVLSNAAKFTEEGYILVRAEVQTTPAGQPELLLVVEDTGPGIPKEAQAKLFTPFYQADSAITRAVGGTGLGLAITRHLVEMHGGRIWIESEEGKGTKVFIRLPLGVPESQRVAFAVVFDDPEAVELYRQHFGAKGYRILGTLDPKEFQARVLSLRPFAGMINPYLPDRKGLQLVHQLAATKETRALPKLLTAVAAQEQRLFVLPFLNVLVKPIRREDMAPLPFWQAALDMPLPIRCLFVEREPQQAEYLRSTLAQEVPEMELVVVPTVTEAFDHLREAPFHAVFLDLLAPGDPMALLHLLRETHGQQPFPLFAVLDNTLSTEAWGLLDLLFRRWWSHFLMPQQQALYVLERFLYYLELVHRQSQQQEQPT